MRILTALGIWQRPVVLSLLHGSLEFWIGIRGVRESRGSFTFRLKLPAFTLSTKYAATLWLTVQHHKHQQQNRWAHQFSTVLYSAQGHTRHTRHIYVCITCGVCMCLCVNVCTRALFHKTQGEVARARAASPVIFQCGRRSCSNSNSGGQCITCGPRSVGTVIVLSSCHRTASYTNILTHTHAYTLKWCVFVLCCYDDDDVDDDGGTCARRIDMLWRRNLSRTHAHADFENKRNII